MPFNLMAEAFEALHDRSLPTIELLQTSFPDNKNFMMNISTLLDPRYVFLIYAPILFAINKRVGHRTIIALTLTEWANQILKWLLAGERPYWYVHERAHELASAASGPPGQPGNFGTAGHNITGAGLSAALSGIDSYDMAAILVAKQQPQPPLLQLKQFPVTCELGAGSPSGHAMVTATVWYILIDAYLKGELPLFSRAGPRVETIDGGQQQTSSSSSSSSLQQISWAIYGTMLLLVSMSRVYLACHFPHQCLCGAALGMLVARLVVERLPMQRLGRRHFCLATCLMFASALGTYASLRLMGRNPLWSVDKGMRWCVKKEYIHLDTTPFFSMVRYLGFCLGAGLAYDGSKISPQAQRKGTRSPSDAGLLLSKEETRDTGNLLLFRRFTAALAAILFGQFLLSLPIPKTNLNLFYVISFLMYTIFSYSIAAPIPQLTKLTFGTPASAPSSSSCSQANCRPPKTASQTQRQQQLKEQ